MINSLKKIYKVLLLIYSFVWEYLKPISILLLAVGIILYWQQIVRSVSLWLVVLGAVGVGIERIR